MNAVTKLSDTGQVVIPKDVRDRLSLSADDRLEVSERGGGILMRKTAARSGESFVEVTARIRAMEEDGGPSATINEINTSIREAAACHAIKRDDRARG